MESALTSPVVKSFLAGSFSGTCSTLLFQPLDLVKTRVQSSVTISGSRPLGMCSVVATVIQQEKILGLWRGVAPSISRCVPGIGIYFSTIHYLKGHFQHSKSPLESMVIGGTARTVAVVTMLPFTVLKTRYESAEFHYNNMAKALTSIYKTEGIKGLYSGLSATILRDVPFSGLYFMFYTQLKQLPTVLESKWQTVWTSDQTPSYSASDVDPKCLRDVPGSGQPFFHFSCGVTAGMMASIITQPADVVKTHIQLYPHRYKSLLKAGSFVYERDGIMGFWRGIIPRTIRRTLMAALAWTVYEEVSKSCGLK